MNHFYNVTVSPYPDNTPVVSKGFLKSVAPDKIIHEDQVFPGEATILKIEGGELGLGAKWVWYKDNCKSKSIGKGENISVVAQNSCTYYVRAEGIKDTSECIGAFVKVSENSIIGDSIKGSSIICNGEKNVRLVLLGGKLGKSSEWKWYKDDCAGKSIGTGRTIEVNPNGTTTYYVRAEGLNDLSICLKKEIFVTDKSIKPIEIIGKSNGCQGEVFNFIISGGKLAAGSNWIWYENRIDENNIVGRGESINIKANTNTNYIVRAEGACNSTESITKKITVNTISLKPYDIEVNYFGLSSFIPKGRHIFTIKGGVLAENAKWVWYKSDLDGKKIVRAGSGETIKTRLKKNSTIIVRAEGGTCDDDNGYLKKKYNISNIDNKNITKKTSTKSNNKYSTINLGIVSSTIITNSNVNPITPYNMVLTYMKNNNSKMSWYIKGKYCINSEGESVYQTTDKGFGTSNSTLSFNGNVAEERYGATFGLIIGHKKLKYFLGAGYGKRVLKWGVNENSYNSQTGQIFTSNNNEWATNTERSYEGLELESGVILKLSKFNILAGISTLNTTFNYFDLHLGFGYNFK